MWNRWSQCPKFSVNEHHNRRISDLDEDIRTLTIAQNSNTDGYINMKNDLMLVKNDITEMRGSLKNHMDDEAEHHAKTNETLQLLLTAHVEAEKANDAREKEKLKVKEQELEDKKEKEKELRAFFLKIAFVIIIAVGGSLGTFIYKSVDYYSEAMKMQKIQKHLYGVEKFEEEE